jgi:CBS domain containing-hemolysin-like protein
MPPDTLTTVPRDATVAEVEDVCAATGFSRFPVTSGNHGSAPVGYLHIKDVLEIDETRRDRQIEPRWIRPLAPVRASDSLHDALEILQRRGSHMATVSGDDGGFLGVATLEDVIEELVGEIRDAAHE